MKESLESLTLVGFKPTTAFSLIVFNGITKEESSKFSDDELIPLLFDIGKFMNQNYSILIDINWVRQFNNHYRRFVLYLYNHEDEDYEELESYLSAEETISYLQNLIQQ